MVNVLFLYLTIKPDNKAHIHTSIDVTLSKKDAPGTKSKPQTSITTQPENVNT